MDITRPRSSSANSRCRSKHAPHMLWRGPHVLHPSGGERRSDRSERKWRARNLVCGPARERQHGRSANLSGLRRMWNVFHNPQNIPEGGEGPNANVWTFGEIDGKCRGSTKFRLPTSNQQWFRSQPRNDADSSTQAREAAGGFQDEFPGSMMWSA